MSSRFASRSALAVLWLTGSLALAGCKQDIHFTKAPVFGAPPAAPVRRDPTAISVATPIELAAVRRAAEDAVPEKLPRIVDWVYNATCAKRTQWVECAGARVDIDLERKAPSTLAVARGAVTVEVPLQFTTFTRGLGWARDVTETRRGEVVATLTIEAGLAGDFEPEVRIRDEVTVSEPQLPAMKARVAIGPHIAVRLRRALIPVADALRRELAAAGIRSHSDRAWAALHAPLEFNRDPQAWLRTEPESVHAGGFVTERGVIAYRTVIQTRVATFSGQRPTPLLPRPLPVLAREPAGEVRTRLLLPVPISTEAMLGPLRAAFPATEILRTGDGDTPPVAVKVREANLLPARGLLSVELQLDVADAGPWFGLIGSAYFVGRPVIRPQSGLLELEEISLPDQPPPRNRAAVPTQFPVSERERRYARGTAEPQRGPRIGLEPFASRIAKAARMDMSRLLRDVVPHTNSMLAQPLSHGVRLGGRFEEAAISNIVPTRGGLEVTFELTGSLAITVEPGAESGFALPGRPESERTQ